MKSHEETVFAIARKIAALKANPALLTPGLSTDRREVLRADIAQGEGFMAGYLSALIAVLPPDRFDHVMLQAEQGPETMAAMMETAAKFTAPI